MEKLSFKTLKQYSGMNPLSSEVFRMHRIAILAALAFSIAILVLSPIMPLIDSAGYMDTAKSLHLGRGFQSNYETDITSSPGLPYTAALFMSVFGWEGTSYMKAFLAVFAFLLFISMYLFSLEVSNDRKASLLASVLFVLIAEVIFNAMQMLTDTMFMVFMLLSITFYLKALKDGSLKSAAICGITAGLFVLARYIGVVVLGIFLVHAVFRRYRHGESLRTVSIVFILAALVFLPWILLGLSMGFMPVMSHVSGSLAERTASTEIDITRFFGGSLLQAWTGPTITVPVQSLNIVKMIGSAVLYTGPVALGMFFYLIFLGWKRKRKQPFGGLLLLWLGLFFVFHIALSADFSARYILPFIPPVLVVVSKSILDGWKARRNLMIALVASQVVLSLAVIAYDSSNRWANSNTMTLYHAGEWIRDNTQGEDILYEIGSGGPWMTYYADKRTVSLGDPVEESQMVEIRGLAPGTVLITNVMPRSLNEQRLIEVMSYELCANFSDSRFFARVYRANC
jgi:4-amino-4-deoxy-L-arabinose transferase-like glycosyltransferase